METYNRLELIRELLKKFNKFFISVLHLCTFKTPN